jgi:hypothetical protein
MYLSSGVKLAAFRQDYSAPRQPVPGTSVAYSADGVRNHLPGDLMAALVNGTVALGLQGPCWGHADDPLGPYRPRPFEGPGRGWYAGSRGPAALKAATLLAGMAVLIRDAIAEVTYGLAGQPPITGQPGTVWLWEAYLAGCRAGAALPADAVETWSWQGSQSAVDVDAHAVNDQMVDAFRTIRYGFANLATPTNPQRDGRRGTYAAAPRHVVPIIGPALAGVGLVRSGPGWWDEPCMVIAPSSDAGHLMWP